MATQARDYKLVWRGDDNKWMALNRLQQRRTNEAKRVPQTQMTPGEWVQWWCMDCTRKGPTEHPKRDAGVRHKRWRAKDEGGQTPFEECSTPVPGTSVVLPSCQRKTEEKEGGSKGTKAMSNHTERQPELLEQSNETKRATTGDPQTKGIRNMVESGACVS